MGKSDVVLAEYKALRDAILANFRLQLQVYTVYASALLVFYGLVFEHKVYDIILVIPIFSLALLFRLLWQEIIIRRVSEYISEMEEKKIPKLIGTINAGTPKDRKSANLCIGWQHFWEEMEEQNKWPRYYEYSRIMLFVVFSVIPSVVYIVYNILAYFTKLESVTKLPSTKLSVIILLLILVLNSLIGFYMLYKIKNVFPRPSKRRRHV